MNLIPLPIADQSNPELEQTLAGLTFDQIRFVTAMLELGDKGKAATAIGLAPTTVYHWPPEVDKAIRLIALDTQAAARYVLRQGVIKAVMVTMALMDSEDETVRGRAARDVVEWVMGRARQQTDIAARVEIVDYRTDILSKLSKIIDASDPIEVDR